MSNFNLLYNHIICENTTLTIKDFYNLYIKQLTTSLQIAGHTFQNIFFQNNNIFIGGNISTIIKTLNKLSNIKEVEIPNLINPLLIIPNSDYFTHIMQNGESIANPIEPEDFSSITRLKIEGQWNTLKTPKNQIVYNIKPKILSDLLKSYQFDKDNLYVLSFFIFLTKNANQHMFSGMEETVDIDKPKDE